MEYFDLYTIDRKPLEKISARGNRLNKNEYHIVVMAILINTQGEVLLTKRSKNKIAAGFWECTAGSVLAGENGKEAIAREIKEEIGINVQITDNPISEYFEDDAIFDLWVININISIDDLILQTEEVDEAKYVTLKDIQNIINSGIAAKSLSELIRLNNIGLISIKES